MTATYFDTSALIKRYINEPDSPTICSAWDAAEAAASCWLLYPEMVATFARKRREGIMPQDHVTLALSRFVSDWPALIRIGCDDALLAIISELHGRYSLRGADSVHLAAAIYWRGLEGGTVSFACSDTQLRQAAMSEGFVVIP